MLTRPSSAGQPARHGRQRRPSASGAVPLMIHTALALQVLGSHHVSEEREYFRRLAHRLGGQPARHRRQRRPSASGALSIRFTLRSPVQYQATASAPRSDGRDDSLRRALFFSSIYAAHARTVSGTRGCWAAASAPRTAEAAICVGRCCSSCGPFLRSEEQSLSGNQRATRTHDD